MKYSKTIVAIALAGLLLATSLARAQTAEDTNRAYIVALVQLIDLLTKQVTLLQAQLAVLQNAQESGPGIGMPAGATATNVRLDEGVLQPKLEIQARILHTEQRGADRYFTERPVEGSTVFLGKGDSLRILAIVGNPDPAFTPSFSCERFGGWTGPVTHDQWFEGVRPTSSVWLGIACTDSSGAAVRDGIQVTLDN